MRQVILLRAAAIVGLLFAIGHLMGGLKKWSPMSDNPVLEQMTNVRFEVMGTSRTYLDFYQGFGWSIGILMLMQAALLWQFSSLARQRFDRVRPMVAVIAIANVVSALLTLKFLFLVPALFSFAFAALLVAACFGGGRKGAANG